MLRSFLFENMPLGLSFVEQHIHGGGAREGGRRTRLCSRLMSRDDEHLGDSHSH
jgi:hypothetical protein